MKSIKKNILYGILTWLIPFLIAIPFHSKNGELMVDKIFFKTIMIIAGTLVGVFLIVKYFKSVKADFLKEGILLGISWLLINWILDFIILIPLNNITYQSYFIETGLRYLTIPIISITIATLLKHKYTGK